MPGAGVISTSLPESPTAFSGPGIGTTSSFNGDDDGLFIWYRFTAPEDGVYSFDLTKSLVAGLPVNETNSTLNIQVAGYNELDGWFEGVYGQWYTYLLAGDKFALKVRARGKHIFTSGEEVYHAVYESLMTLEAFWDAVNSIYGSEAAFLAEVNSSPGGPSEPIDVALRIAGPYAPITVEDEEDVIEIGGHAATSGTRWRTTELDEDYAWLTDVFGGNMACNFFLSEYFLGLDSETKSAMATCSWDLGVSLPQLSHPYAAPGYDPEVLDPEYLANWETDYGSVRPAVGGYVYPAGSSGGEGGVASTIGTPWNVTGGFDHYFVSTSSVYPVVQISQHRIVNAWRTANPTPAPPADPPGNRVVRTSIKSLDISADEFMDQSFYEDDPVMVTDVTTYWWMFSSPRGDSAGGSGWGPRVGLDEFNEGNWLPELGPAGPGEMSLHAQFSVAYPEAGGSVGDGAGSWTSVPDEHLQDGWWNEVDIWSQVVDLGTLTGPAGEANAVDASGLVWAANIDLQTEPLAHIPLGRENPEGPVDGFGGGRLGSTLNLRPTVRRRIAYIDMPPVEPSITGKAGPVRRIFDYS